MLSKKRNRQIQFNLIPQNPNFISLYGRCSDHGCEAWFYRMGGAKYGIKVYTDLENAIKSYNRQRIAASHQVGPQVVKFLLVKLQNEVCFGYETEKAKRVKEDSSIWRKQKYGLRRKLKRLGLCGDFCDVNCGVIGDRLVAVDFGSHSKAK